MAYQINKTNGTILTSLADGQIDQASSDITLIGKNYSGFGEILNENLVRMLENFSNSVAPERPLQGQLWYDTTDLKLKIYNGTQFIPIGSATLSQSQPSSLTAGDLWYDQSKGQLFFFDGNAIKLLGPDWSLAQGQSGLVVGNVFDITNTNRVIVYLYCSSVLLGIFSKENFVPKSPIPGFSGSIVAGFNASALNGLKFNVTATNSESLGKDITYPTGIPAASYVRNDTDVSLAGAVSITNNNGLSIGNDSQLKLDVSNNNVSVKIKRSGVNESAIVFSPSTRSIDFYPLTQENTGTIPKGIFHGDFEVTGQFTINPENAVQITYQDIVSTVYNKNIFLAYNDVQTTDTLASGGGIVLKGSTDHSLTWTKETFAWNSTEHINLVSSTSVTNPEFKINGITVLAEGRLGESITSAPGITNFGTQEYVVIGRETEIGTLTPSLKLIGSTLQGLESTRDIELSPAIGRSVSLVGSPRITGVGYPLQSQDAASKQYVDDSIKTRSIVFSMDLTDNKSNDYIITNVLNKLAPVDENKTGTIARILCTILSNNPQSVNVNLTTETFSKQSGTGLAVTGVSASLSPTAAGITTTRVIKKFTIISNQWTYVSPDEVLP